MIAAFIQAITESTLIPIGVAVALFVALGSYTAWIARQFANIERGMDKMSSDLRIEIGELRHLLSERFTKEDFRRWEREFFRANPTLRPPDDVP